jgi:hypothetical protein
MVDVTTAVVMIMTAFLTTISLGRATTEHRGRVLHTSASCSEGPLFKSRPAYRLSLLRYFVLFLSAFRPGFLNRGSAEPWGSARDRD